MDNDKETKEFKCPMFDVSGVLSFDDEDSLRLAMAAPNLLDALADFRDVMRPLERGKEQWRGREMNADESALMHHLWDMFWECCADRGVSEMI
jgi:hypothetical protein